MLVDNTIPVILRPRNSITLDSSLILPIKSPRRQTKTHSPKVKANMAKMRRMKDARNHCVRLKHMIEQCISEGGIVKFQVNMPLIHKSLELIIQSAYDAQIARIPKEK